MSIILEKCSTCNGTGVERFSFSDIPFHGGSASCWSCEGTGEVAVMPTVTELGDMIFAGREKKQT